MKPYIKDYVQPKDRVNPKLENKGNEGMLVLSRRYQETIMIDDNIEIKVLSFQNNHVYLGFKAPKNVKIFRKEIYDLIKNGQGA